MKSWNNCITAMSDERCSALAEERGIPYEFFVWLRDQKLVGLYEGSWAFPIFDQDRNPVGCHVRLSDRWTYHWFVTGAESKTITPLVLGNPKDAAWAFIFESQWDAFAVASAYSWHTEPEELKNGCIIITRGAQSGGRIKDLLPAGCASYAWKQNDLPGKNGKVSAADK